ncbi:glycosyltransferase family 4 protein [Candidatus Contubernalis alkalaceticus]|nr:glycosyltransferase family 4 protein [Candidatus Contubernalis alkalaceticus]
MRIMMFSWEYPPKSVGGLAQHVYDLTSALVETGQEVDLITVGDHQLPSVEKVKGITVHRVTPYDLTTPHFIPWIIQLNISMLEVAVSLFNTEQYDLVHAHDWLVAYAGRALKHIYKVPLIATIHATEYGRNNGLHNDDQRYISDVEWWLGFEAWKVICCSSYMEKELKNIFGLPKDKISVIYNGVDIENYQANVSKEAVKSFRNQFASPEEKIVFFVGRLVKEKGVQVLLEAAPQILNYHPKTKFVIAGKGPMMNDLRNKALDLGIAERVIFTGYVDDDTRNLLYASSDAAVFPSLYEPFGIVALEGMATRTPVIVSDTGGLSEIIEHNVDGLKAFVENPISLADNILKVLMDEKTAKRLSQTAYRKVTDHFSWMGIARKTVTVYEEVLDYYRQSPWSAENEELYKTMLQSLSIQQGKQEEYAVHASPPGLNLRKH